jgi:hypothetical protein
VADVQEPHDAHESGTVEHVADESRERGAVGLRGAGVAVAGEIQEITVGGNGDVGRWDLTVRG